MIKTEDMEEVEVILEEVIFEAGLIIILDETVVGIEIERIEGHGDKSRSRERGMRARSKSSSRSSSRASTNKDRVRCFKCREYDHFANECPNLVPDDSDRESDGARSASLQILADNDTGSAVEQYLNI